MAVQISGNDITVPRDGTFSRNVSIAGTLTYEDVTNVDSVGLITARQGIKIGSGVGVAASISVDGNAEFAGIVTASSFVGSGANLTGVASTDNIRTNTNATFLKNINVSGIATVGSAVTISESGIEASGIGITVANINGGQIGGRRNLIINGDMRLAQRGTSSTSSGYQTVDRFSASVGGTDEAPTQAQVDLSSSDTPYSLGFRKAFKFTNGNQTGGAGAGDYVALLHTVEAQDIANSGWNYTDSSSNITMSFWAKSSVSKTFILSLYTQDGTDYAYNHKYALAANTWTKIIHTFPGNSNLTFNNDNGTGIQFQWIMYYGTTYTSGSTVDQWVTYGGFTSTPDDTDDWYVQNDATWEITGIQLEVGSQATVFEHLSFAEQQRLCFRYYQSDSFTTMFGNASGGVSTPKILFPIKMRTAPSTFTVNYNDNGSGTFRNQNDGSTLTGHTTYDTADNGFSARGSNGTVGSIIYSSTYFAHADF